MFKGAYVYNIEEEIVALEVGQENIRKERQYQYVHLTHNGRMVYVQYKQIDICMRNTNETLCSKPAIHYYTQTFEIHATCHMNSVNTTFKCMYTYM